MRKILPFIFIALIPFFGQTQILANFETAQTTPAFTAEGEVAVVDNPDKSGINTSDKVGYYNKIEGNWHYVTITFDENVPIGYNNTLTFKIHASVQGRIFAKFWINDEVLIEDWAPIWEFQPAANTWVECVMDLTPAMGKEFTKLELAACVDNEAAADVYFDDVELSNPELGDGSPKAKFSVSKTKVNVAETVNFDASASFDYDGEITSYAWDFGDGATATGVTASHSFSFAQNAKVKLTITDNDGKSSADSTIVFVFSPDQKISDLEFTSPNQGINQKVEAIFQINGDYENVYNPDEVMVDALVQLPNGATIQVPCFYFVNSYMSGSTWVIDSSYQGWMLRFLSPQAGMHNVFVRVTDNEGIVNSNTFIINIDATNAKGIIQSDANNHQYYRHQTGEPFFPMGINIGWNSIDKYTKIIKNLSAGKANIYRYWHTPFAQQALEWKKTSFYDGLGKYSQLAAAMTDSLISLNEATDMYMQLAIFQHGMFSENVNEMWADNPYNTVNGGFVDRAEEYFYNDACKAQTKKLLRYIVARWGYSKNIFAWEFFNEVQFTGIHNSQTSQWFPGVVKWHSEMSQYIQSIDPFNHIMTTSAEHDQLASFDSISAIDNIQYHLYANNLLEQQTKLDFQFRDELKNLSIVNGEYGTNAEADVPFDMQRTAIWNSIMTQVPHYMWIWEHYEDQTWANLFKMPAEFITDEDFGSRANLQTFEFDTEHGTKTFKSLGLTDGYNFYGYLYDEFNGNIITGASLILKDIPFANYIVTYYLPSTGETLASEVIPLIKLTNKLALPDFSKGLAFKIKYYSKYEFPIAIAGNDTLVAPGITVNLSAAMSFSQVSNTTLTYQWNIDEKPVGSSASIAGATAVNTSITPDVSGIYKISLMVNDGFNISIPDVIQITVSNPPVAVLGNDTIVSESENYFHIDGSKSYDPDGDAITYKWKLVSWPAESRGDLLNIDQPKAILKLDALGEFVVGLVVFDGISESEPESITITVNGTGISQGIASAALNVYPNPTMGEVWVTAPGISAIEVMDVTGRIIAVENFNINATKVRLNLSAHSFNKGVLVLKIYNNNNVFVKKIILTE